MSATALSSYCWIAATFPVGRYGRGYRKYPDHPVWVSCLDIPDSSLGTRTPRQDRPGMCYGRLAFGLHTTQPLVPQNGLCSTPGPMRDSGHFMSPKDSGPVSCLGGHPKMLRPRLITRLWHGALAAAWHAARNGAQVVGQLSAPELQTGLRNMDIFGTP